MGSMCNGMHPCCNSSTTKDALFLYLEHVHICDPKLQIINVNAHYPGSVHNSFIWRNSKVREALAAVHASASNTRSYRLLGNTGYPLEPWLMTPIMGENLSVSEQAFNAAHL